MAGAILAARFAAAGLLALIAIAILDPPGSASAAREAAFHAESRPLSPGLFTIF